MVLVDWRAMINACLSFWMGRETLRLMQLLRVEQPEPLRFGYRIALYCYDKKGFIIGTTSGVAPVGVAEDTPHSPLTNFEQAIFTIYSGDRDDGTGQHEGEPVKFGSVVRLVHHKQHKAITYNSKLHSIVDPGTNRVTLESHDHPEQWGKWRILPRFKLRVEGETVCEGDHIVLQVSSGDKMFLGVANRQDEASDGCFEVHAGNVSAGFAIKIYDKENVTTQSKVTTRPILRAGDCLLMYHKERHGYVSQGKDGRFLLRPVADSFNATTAGSMFILEQQDRYRGGVVCSGRSTLHRLKDLRTGYYLIAVRAHVDTVAKQGDEKSTSVHFELTPTPDESATLFAFHQVGEAQGTPLRDRAKVFVELPLFEDYGTWIAQGEPIAAKKHTLRDGFRLEQLHTQRNRELSQQQHVIRGSDFLSHSDGFEIQRIADTVYQTINVIISLLPPIHHLQETIATQLPDYARIIQVQENLAQLRSLSYGFDANGLRAIDEKAQTYLHDRGVASACLALAHEIMQCPFVNYELLHSSEPIFMEGMPDVNPSQVKYADFFEIVQLCFGVVEQIVKDQPTHATALQEEMEFMVMAVPNIPAALDCFLACITKNDPLVDTTDSKITRFFCDLFQQRCRCDGALKALTLLCCCDGHGITHNQQETLARLLSDRQTAMQYFVRVTVTSGEVQVAVPNTYFEESKTRLDTWLLCSPEGNTGATWVSLSKLKGMATAPHLPRFKGFIDFLVTQIDLFAAVCASKNSSAVASTMSLVSLEAITPGMLSEDVPAALRAAFVRFFVAAVLDAENATDLREVCRSLHYVVREPLALQLEAESNPMFDVIKTFAWEHLRSIASLSYDASIDELVLAESIVRLIHGLVFRGLFPTSQYPELIAQLIAIVDSRDDKSGSTKITKEMKEIPGIAEVIARFAAVQCEALSVVDSLLTFLSSKMAIDACDRFCHGQKLQRISQLFDLDPNSTLGEAAEHAHNGSTGNPLAMFEMAHHHSFKSLSDVLAACMDAAYRRSPKVRDLAVRLFCRLTAFPKELLASVTQIQLLSNKSAAQYYREAKQYADDLGKCTRIVLADDSVEHVTQVLEAVENLLLSPTGGSQLDKIGVLRQLQVPRHIMVILRNLPSSPNVALHSLIIQAVNFLRTLGQDDEVAELILSAIEDIHHLTSGDVDLLSLLRSVFIGRPTIAQRITVDTVNEVVTCLGYAHSAVEAVLFLQDLVRTKSIYSRYMSSVQDAVWRSLCSNYAAHNVVRTKIRWSGPQGRKMRDELLKSAEYYNDMGFLRLHLETLKLVFYITKFNPLTRIEEVRHELFGPTALEDILEVVSNPSLPVNFRKPYVNLMQTLVIQDIGQRMAFFTHRSLPRFIRISITDVRALRAKLGESVDLLGPPGTVAEDPANRDLEESRNSLAVYLDLVLMGITPCVKYICSHVAELKSARVSEKVLTEILDSLNQLIDEYCDLVKFTHIVNKIENFPEFEMHAHGYKKLFLLLKAAMKHKLKGTSAWAEDFDGILLAVETHMPHQVIRIKKDGDGSEASEQGERDAPELSETQRWVNYYTKHIAHGPAMIFKNEFVTAAGVILRSGVLGARFLRSACNALRHLPENELLGVLSILRQVCTVSETHAMDDARILDADAFVVNDAIPGEGKFTFSLTLAERQNVMASWILADRKNPAVLPAVVSLVAWSYPLEVVGPAVKTAIQLLDGGNLNMQRTLNDCFQGRPDEIIFVYLRSRFSMFRDALRMYNRLTESGEEAEREDPDSVIDLLRLCQLFCEGHYSELQDYMRHQADNQVSVNGLESFDSLLDCVVGHVEPPVLPLLLQLLDTIAETVQGPCKANQEVFIAMGISDSIASLVALDKEDAPNLSDDDIENIRNGAVVVLLSLLEGRSEAPQLASLVASMSLRRLIVAMDRSYDIYVAAHGASLLDLPKHLDPLTELNDELSVGVQVFIIFKTCLDVQTLFGVEGFQFTDSEGMTLKEALGKSKSYKFINTRVATIEIARGNAIERVYFRVPTLSRLNLRDSSKDNLIKEVKRDSDAARQRDFFERCQKLILELEYYEKMRTIPVLSLIHEYSDKLDVLSLVVAIAINLTLIFTLHAPQSLYVSDQSFEADAATTALGIIHIVLQCILFVHFGFGPMTVYLDNNWLNWQDDENREAAQESRNNLSIHRPHVRFDRIQKVTWPAYIARSCWFLAHSPLFWQRALVLIAAFLGYLQSKIWYSVQLLQVVSVSPQLYNVVLAVTRNGGSLLQTFGLQVIVIYIFSMISYYSYSGLFFSKDESFSCHTLFNCFLVSVDTGLRNGGGIADSLPAAEFHDSRGAGRLFFDILFFVIVIVIFLNIVFGIIVDTFGSLREERESIEEDQTTKCFICGIDGNDFDRVTAGGFEHHIAAEHNMWNYLFFFHYVKIKPLDKLNGVEHYVRELINLNEPAFFPVGKALLLEKYTAAILRLRAREEKPLDEDEERDRKLLDNTLSTSADFAALAGQLVQLTGRVAKMQRALEQAASASGEANRGPASMLASFHIPAPSLP